MNNPYAGFRITDDGSELSKRLIAELQGKYDAWEEMMKKITDEQLYRCDTVKECSDKNTCVKGVPHSHDENFNNYLVHCIHTGVHVSCEKYTNPSTPITGLESCITDIITGTGTTTEEKVDMILGLIST